MLINYGANEFIEYRRRDGTMYTRPLLQGVPQIIFKGQNSPIQIKFKFRCPFEDCSCSRTISEKQAARLKGKLVKVCPFRRHIKFLDSCLVVPASLSAMVDDLHIAREKEGISLKDMFPRTYSFAQTQHLSDIMFSCLLRKIPMPFELISSFEQLTSITSPPKPEQFASFLKGTTTITQEEMAVFTDTWNTLGVSNLLEMYFYYGCADVTLLSDAMTFYLTKLHKITGLFGSHYITLSSMALSSSLLNSKDPKRPHRTVFLPFLEEETYQKFDESLVGGFSVNQAFYSFFNNGFLDSDFNNPLLSKHFRSIMTGFFVDFNALYPR